MKFRFDVKTTDEDYLKFNKFIFFRAPYGRKIITRYRIFIAICVGIICAVSLIGNDFSRESLTGIIAYALVLIMFEFLIVPVYGFVMKKQIKMLKRTGKLPYSPEAVLEFYDDKFVEITESCRTEQNYNSVERISIVGDEVIYIHVDTMRGYVLPRCCLGSDTEYNDFVEFLRSKCAVIDSY